MEKTLIITILSSWTIAVHAQGFTVNSGKKPEKPVNPYQLSTAGQASYKLVTDANPLKAIPQKPPALPEHLQAKPFAREIESAARASELDPILVHALIHVESRHQADAISPKGALGLMQVLPETAQRFGINNPGKPEQNLLAGTRYLRSLLNLFDQRIDLALAAYNAGEGAVLRYGGNIPPFPETQHYVPSVLEKYESWRPEQKKLQIQYLPGTVLDPKALSKTRIYPERNEIPSKPLTPMDPTSPLSLDAPPQLLMETVLEKAECFEECP